MSRFNSVPVIVQQMVESMGNKNNPEYIRYNHSLTVEAIRDYCDMALSDWTKQQNKKAVVRVRKY